MSSAIKEKIQDDMKAAMRAKNQKRLDAIRLVLAAIKQREVDDRKEMEDQDIIAILDKLAKQRRESISHFEQASRQDLIDQETFELALIQEYLPEPLSDEKVNELIDEAIKSTQATSIRDMGKVMAELKPKLQGKTDLGKVTETIKSRLNQ